MKILPALFPGLALMVVGLPQATAQSSLQHSSQALTHSLNAVGHSFIGGAQLVSGVVAVPLKASAAVGELSGEMGDAFWEAANAPVVDPLPITGDVVTIGPPPAEALNPDFSPGPSEQR
jgi:hypothetical protein